MEPTTQFWVLSVTRKESDLEKKKAVEQEGRFVNRKRRGAKILWQI